MAATQIRTHLADAACWKSQPASQAKVQLVGQVTPAVWKQCGAVMTPIRLDTASSQPSTKVLVTALVAIPPDQADEIGKVVFRLLDTSGKTTAEHPAQVNTLNAEGRFFRAEAQWPTDKAAPGACLPLGIVYDREGNARQWRASDRRETFCFRRC